jgi:hypothetical protein
LTIVGNIILVDTNGEAASDGAFFHFTGCHNLKISGGGTIHGQGFQYWQTVNSGGGDSRPSMYVYPFQIDIHQIDIMKND